jgi:hypothetical protein
LQATSLGAVAEGSGLERAGLAHGLPLHAVQPGLCRGVWRFSVGGGLSRLGLIGPHGARRHSGRCSVRSVRSVCRRYSSRLLGPHAPAQDTHRLTAGAAPHWARGVRLWWLGRHSRQGLRELSSRSRRRRLWLRRCKPAVDACDWHGHGRRLNPSARGECAQLWP